MNQLKLHVYDIIIPFLVLFFSLIIFSSNGINVSANAVPSLDNYTYSLDTQKSIVNIKGYTGNGEDLRIPVSFVIDGETYSTKIVGTCSITGVKKLSFERGVVISGNRVFYRSGFEEVDFTGAVGAMTGTLQHFLSYNSELTKITWGDFNISEKSARPVSDMEYMCYKCPKLKELDLSTFDTSGMTYMSEMVTDCDELESLNLRGLDFTNFDTSGSLLMQIGMEYCTKLKYVYAPVNVPASGVYKLPGIFVDAQGNEYNKLPIGLTESIMLYSTERAPEVRAILNLPDETTWQEEFSYRVNRGFIYPYGYVGDAKDIYIPATAVVGLDECDTRISATEFYNTGKVSFEDGVIVSRGFSFEDSTFSEIDMTGLKLTSFNSSAAPFDNCANLTRITLPANFTCGGTITLPEVFTGSDGNQYTELPTGNATVLSLVRGDEYYEKEPEAVIQDTEWQKDFTYTLSTSTSNNTIKISGYTGDGTSDLRIPATAVINGITYNTVVTGTCKITGVKKLSFERGVSITGNRVFSRSDFTEIDLTGVQNNISGCLQHFLSFNNSLENIIWGDFDIRGNSSNPIKSIEYLCYQCPKLKELDLSSFDTRNMTYMCEIVTDCESLESVNLRGVSFANFRTDGANLMYFGLDDCKKLQSVYAPVGVSANATYKLPGTFKDSNGNEYTQLPAKLTTSILLTRVADDEITGRLARLKKTTETVATENSSGNRNVQENVKDKKTTSVVVQNKDSEVKQNVAPAKDNTSATPDQNNTAYTPATTEPNATTAQNASPAQETPAASSTKVTEEATISESTDGQKKSEPIVIKGATVGTKITVSGIKYQVTGKNAVKCIGISTKGKSTTVPASVKINGKIYRVTAVESNSYKNNKNITKASLGANVTRIGANAFLNCKNLKELKIYGNNLKSIGKNCVKGIKKGASITIICRDKKVYNNLVKKLKSAGATKAKYKYKKG